MTKHIYSIGQSVRLGVRAGIDLDPMQMYTVTALLPPVGVELQYRVRNAREKHERVAVEHLISIGEPQKVSSAAQSRLSQEAEIARVFETVL